jgi:hypothetical protein
MFSNNGSAALNLNSAKGCFQGSTVIMRKHPNNDVASLIITVDPIIATSKEFVQELKRKKISILMFFEYKEPSQKVTATFAEKLKFEINLSMWKNWKFTSNSFASVCVHELIHAIQFIRMKN